jgi:hypothetical protein
MEELNRKQLIKLMWIISLNTSASNKNKLIVLMQSMSLPLYQRLQFQAFYLLFANRTERTDIMLCTQSLRDFDQYTEQKIKIIAGTFVQLYGPESGLANCSFWEYIKAEKYYLNYLATNEREWLDKMVATLYRTKKTKYRKNTDPDIRIPLNDHSMNFQLARVKKIDIHTKMAILKWFDSCRNLLAVNFPTVFTKAEIKAENKNALEMIKQGPNTNVRHTAWLNLIAELAGSMDNYEKIGNTNLYVALNDIAHRIRKKSTKTK